ncbi:MAG TPA: hypothetical protein VFW07_26630 [Parafilimonas sp.]|nr:hypothetical protein [Parafilimonas sp.]
MKRIFTNPFILLLVCAAQCCTLQHCSAQTGSDSLYTYGTASPGEQANFTWEER